MPHRPRKDFLIDHERNVRAFLKAFVVPGTVIRTNIDGSTEVDGTVRLQDIAVPIIPIRFGKIFGDFIISRSSIDTIERFPSYVNHISLFDTRVTSFEGIHNVVKRAKSISASTVNSNVLGVLYIKDLHSVYVENQSVSLIINKYLCKSSEPDIFACQNDLLEAGFAEYAKL